MNYEPVECRECGNEYQKIGQHWSKGSTCSAPDLTDRQRDIVVALMMGDGCLHRSGKNSSLECTMIAEKYLNYLDGIFGSLSCGVKFIESAEESARRNRDSGFRPNAKAENYHDKYKWRTRSLPELNKYNSWYETGNIVWPEDIELTPTVLKHWYCSDGCYNNKNRHNYIAISSANEAHNEEKVNGYFTQKGLPTPSWRYNERKDGGEYCQMQFTVSESQELFDYMGDPLPGFHYKWGMEEPDGPIASDTGTVEEVVA